MEIGDKAPDFVGVNQNGEEVSLESLRGKKVVLYFYPRDNTTGCTAEACSLRDGYSELIKMGFVVVGVSADSVASHKKFVDKNALPFDLISDTEKHILTAYGVWGEKKLYGKVYMGIIRKTFIIDENGNIEKVFEKVKTKEHFNQIVESYK